MLGRSASGGNALDPRTLARTWRECVARAIVVSISVFGTKAYLLVVLRFVSVGALARVLAFGGDGLLVVLLAGALWLVHPRASWARHLTWVLASAAVLANGLLAAALVVVRQYVRIGDTLPELGRQIQVWQVAADFGSPGAYSLLGILAAALAGGPFLVLRALPASVSAPPAPSIGTIAAAMGAVGVFAIGSVGIGQPSTTAIPVHRNPLLGFFRPDAPFEALFDEEARAIPIEEISKKLATRSPELGFVETTTGIAELRDRPSSVILVVLESVGATALGLGGAPAEFHPFLAESDRRAILFRRYSTPAPQSSSALTSMFCSSWRLPRWPPLDHTLDRCVPLPHVLRSHGVRTGLWQTARFGDWLGRDVFDRYEFDVVGDSGSTIASRKSKGKPAQVVDDMVRERETVSEMLDWIDERCSTRDPFFATYYSWVPHAPYPARFADRPFDQGLPSHDRYLRLVSVVDEQVARIAEAVKGRDCGRPVTLLVTGDHGEAFGEHPANYLHAGYPYQENVWVPLYVLGDGVVPRTTDRVAQHVDLAPTIVDLALGGEAALSAIRSVGEDGAKLPWSGMSLLRDGPPRAAFSVSQLDDGMATVSFGQFKLIRATNGFALFDTDADPREARDLGTSNPALADALGHALDQWAAEISRRYPRP